MTPNSTRNDELPSIFDLEPLEKGGEVARQGFLYQDHVGAGFCIDMVELNDLLEVWFETHDDIMLIWQESGDTIKVEFVQVKHENRSSRWSVSALTEREKKRVKQGDKMVSESVVGTSILEKSLNNSRCKQKTCFRIVTSIDVADDLRLLRLTREHRDRDLANITALIDAIKSKLGDISSTDGTTIAQWTERCFWDKRPDSNAGIGLENRFRLEVIAKKLKYRLYPDHRDELYQRLLALVSHAAVSKYSDAPDDKKIIQAQMRSWITSKLRELNESGPTAKTLQATMTAAGISQDLIQNADILRVAYLAKRLDHDYIRNLAFTEAESEVTSLLQYELARLDSGELSDNGIQFHSRCLNALKALSEKAEFIRDSITFAFLQGYMYERTSRGVHRFIKPRP
jgi:Cap4 dsDNA endonuclease